MSSNLAVINFAVGGTLTVSGKTTLAETILSSSSASFQGLSTTSLNTTGTSTFTSLPTSTQTPPLDAQFTTKVYVDTADTTLNTRIKNTDATQRTYIDASYGTLNTRITDTDATQRTYIDGSYNTLNTRITDTDATQRTYIDGSYNTLNTRITDTDALQRLYIDASYGTLNTRITDTDATQRTYIDNQILNTNNSIRPNRNYTIKQNADFFKAKLSSNPDRLVDFFQLGSSTYIECQNNPTGSPYTLTLDDPKICGGLAVYIWNNSPLNIQIGSKTAPFFIKGRTNQNEIIQSGATMFLISNSVGWVVLDDSSSFKSGQVIQSLKFYNNKGSLSNTIINRTNWTTIFQTTFNAKSNTSSFSCFFDCYWGVNGGGFDYFDTRITVYRNDFQYPAEPVIALKGISFNLDNRGNPIILFPITGMMGSLGVNTYTVFIQARQNDSDDTLTINTNFLWCCDITEVEN